MLLALHLRQHGVQPCVVSFEHLFQLLQSVEAIEYGHVNVEEHERNRLQGLVASTIIDIDAAQHGLKRFNDVLAVIRCHQPICDS